MQATTIITCILLTVANAGVAHAAGCSATTSHAPVAAAHADSDADPYDIVDVALDAGTFKTLVTAAAAAGLVDPLKSEGPFTVFAPTDEAFAKLPAGTVDELLKPQNREKLTVILKYHVVQGRVDSRAAVQAGQAPTLEGRSVHIEASDSGVTVNNAKVVKADVSASNGVIHVIDTVLLPPTDEQAAMDPARRIIERAISHGVPLFNNGDPQACAAVYEVAALSLITLGRDVLPVQVRSDLADALDEAEATTDASDSAWILRRALDRTYGATRMSAKTPGSFRPVVEAPMPAGFPEPGPVGEIIIKDYPAYRAATVTDGGRGAFMKLFGHIKRHEIAMTAPVETRMSDGSGSAESMSFLYGEPTTGQTGADGAVVVNDQPAMTALSLGMRGPSSHGAIQDAVLQLEQWLNGQQQYIAAAPPRLMGYNSPFVPADRRYWEIQIPVARRGS